LTSEKKWFKVMAVWQIISS